MKFESENTHFIINAVKWVLFWVKSTCPLCFFFVKGLIWNVVPWKRKVILWARCRQSLAVDPYSKSRYNVHLFISISDAYSHVYSLTALAWHIWIFNDLSPKLRESSWKICFRLLYNFLSKYKNIQYLSSLVDNSLSLEIKKVGSNPVRTTMIFVFYHFI